MFVRWTEPILPVGYIIFDHCDIRQLMQSKISLTFKDIAASFNLSVVTVDKYSLLGRLERGIRAVWTECGRQVACGVSGRRCHQPTSALVTGSTVGVRSPQRAKPRSHEHRPALKTLKCRRDLVVSVLCLVTVVIIVVVVVDSVLVLLLTLLQVL